MTVRTIPLKQYLKIYRPPQGRQSLRRYLQLLYADPDDRWVIDQLMDIWKRDRGFRSPVLVRPHTRRIRNGCHRSAALMMVNAPTIDIGTSFGDQPPHPAEWQITLTIDGGSSDIWDTLWGAVRSFPIGEDWFESDVFSGGLTEYQGIWAATQAQLPILCDTLVQRLAHVGWAATIIGCHSWNDREQDFSNDSTDLIKLPAQDTSQPGLCAF